ncbi:hypothetical protein Y032_0004g2207 [Ancylostoma ceylanicum]|uniref:Uncharacterized protein n=1 Tax=Ancylostoma ceylanicum TaxID=53326 RepID=A0A016VW85_9BILA|nr:hypothetical protein Y032_0004g2207 [Ancylostoma ceylanicum]
MVTAAPLNLKTPERMPHLSRINRNAHAPHLHPPQQPSTDGFRRLHVFQCLDQLPSRVHTFEGCSRDTHMDRPITAHQRTYCHAARGMRGVVTKLWSLPLRNADGKTKFRKYQL